MPMDKEQENRLQAIGAAQDDDIDLMQAAFALIDEKYSADERAKCLSLLDCVVADIQKFYDHHKGAGAYSDLELKYQSLCSVFHETYN